MPDDAIASQASRPRAENDAPSRSKAARADVDEQLRRRGGRERSEHRRDLLAPADEMPRALVRGVGRGRDRDAGTAKISSRQVRLRSPVRNRIDTSSRRARRSRTRAG